MSTTILDDGHSQVTAKIQPQMLEYYCSSCKSSLAAIFQVDGDFCAECWQIVTHPSTECRL